MAVPTPSSFLNFAPTISARSFMTLEVDNLFNSRHGGLETVLSKHTLILWQSSKRR